MKDGPAVEVRDLSASGGRFIVRDAGARWLELPPLEITFAEGGAVCARAELVRVRSHQPGVYHLGARLCGLAPEGIRRLARFISREYQRRTSDPAGLLDRARSLAVANPLFVRNVLGAHADGPPLSIVDRHLRLEAQLRVEGVAFEGEQRVIHARLLGDPSGALEPGRGYTFLVGGSAVTVFEARCLERRGARVTLSMPGEVRQSTARAARRIAVGAGTSVRVCFSHPRLPGAAVDAPLVDLGLGGLAFELPTVWHGLFPGARLADLRVSLPDRHALRIPAVVRSLREGAPSGRSCCGVELLGSEARQDAQAWRRFVFECLHPHLVDGTGQATRAWSLLQSSRYVELWTPPSGRAHVHQQYRRDWERPERGVGHCLLLESDRGAVGMLAASVIAPGTWLLHHLARDRGGGGGQASLGLAQCRELICGILHRLEVETDLEHFVMYLERGKRWNERLYGDFAAHYCDRQKLSLTPLEVFRRETESTSPDGAARRCASDLAVVEPTPALLELLAARLALTTPALERRALALDEADLTLTAFSEECRRQGHDRRRHVSFVLAGGHPRAALVADSGGEAVNIFGLLNTCRIVPLTEEEPGAMARQALLRHAQQLYRRIGKRHFLFLDERERDDQDRPERLGFERVSGGLRWIGHRDVVPAWSAYLEGLMTPAAAPLPRHAPARRPGHPSPHGKSTQP